MIKRCPQHGPFRGEHCGECGQPGNLLLDESKTETLGRLVAGGLRHFPDDLGLVMDSRGWVNLTALSDVVQSRHRWASKELIIALVESDPKQRYEIATTKSEPDMVTPWMWSWTTRRTNSPSSITAQARRRPIDCWRSASSPHPRDTSISPALRRRPGT